MWWTRIIKASTIFFGLEHMTSCTSNAKTSQKRWVLVSGSNTSLSLKKQIRSCPIRPCVTDSFLNWKGMAKFKFGVFQRFFRNNRKEKMYLADGAVDYGGYQWTGSPKFKIITQNPKMFCLFVFIQKITKKCDYVLCVTFVNTQLTFRKLVTKGWWRVGGVL